MVAWDIRGSARQRKGGAILEQMVARKTVCLKRLGGNRKGELGIGRFLANEKVTKAKIVASWSERTGPASAGRHVLAIDDTCEVKFPTTAQRRRGLGPVKKGNAYGLLVHSMIAVDAASGACLGLVGGQIWTRDGVNPIPHRERPLEERESMRWLDEAAQAKQVLRPAAMITVVDDRESDFYAKWAAVPEARLPHADPGHEGPPAGHRRHVVRRGGQVPGSRQTQHRVAAARRRPAQAQGGGRAALWRGGDCRPQQEDRALPKSVRLRLIEVREIDPPADVEPLHWRLLTTHEIAGAEAAWEIVGWYQLRWVIEQMHRVMKSQGLQLEDSQVASAERLEKLAAVAVKAACIDIQLTQERDGKHELPGSVVFPSRKWRPSRRWFRRSKAAPSGSRTLTRSAVWPGRVGLSPVWVVGTATTSRRDRSPTVAGWKRFYDRHSGRMLGMGLQREVRIP